MWSIANGSRNSSSGSFVSSKTIKNRERRLKQKLKKLEAEGGQIPPPPPPMPKPKGKARMGEMKTRLVTMEVPQTVYPQVKRGIRQIKKEVPNGQMRVAYAADSSVIPYNNSNVKECKARYLRSLLMPHTGPETCPDDIVRLHTVSPQPVTYNLTVPASGKGLVLIYSNNANSLVGYHYPYDGSNFAFDQKLEGALQLPDDFDSGRRTAAEFNIYSTTIPSGQYALNGTLNAVRLDGFLSEIQSFDYNRIPAAIESTFDKVVGVPVGDGITIIALPDSFNVPYTRLNDATPYVTTTGTVALAQIADGSADLLYEMTVDNPSVTWTLNTDVEPINFQFNCDAFNAISLTGQIQITGVNNGPSGGDVEMDIFIGATLYDPFGNIILTEFGVLTGVFKSSLGGQITLPYNFAVNSIEQPVASVKMRVSMTPTATSTVTGTVNLTVQARSQNAARPGEQSPVTIVAYEGVASGSVITIAGHLNFELQPNPDTRRVLKVSYGRRCPGEIEYIKALLSKREAIGLRSVWKMKDYQNYQPMFEELCNLAEHQVAEAFDFGSVLKLIKQRFLPLLYEVLPETQLIGQGVSTLANRFLSKAASGRVAMAMDRPLSSSQLAALMRKSRSAVVVQDKTLSFGEMRVVRMVRFPTIIFNDQDELQGFALYGVVPGNFWAGKHDIASAKTKDGHHVFGLLRPEGVTFETGMDLSLVPIDPVDNTPIMGPLVEGHSCDLAMWLCGHGRFHGMFPVVVTGGLSNSPEGLKVDPNPVFEQKAFFVHAIGQFIGGNSLFADVVMQQPQLFVAGVPFMPKKRKGVDYKIFQQLGIKALALHGRLNNIAPGNRAAFAADKLILPSDVIKEYTLVDLNNLGYNPSAEIATEFSQWYQRTYRDNPKFTYNSSERRATLRVGQFLFVLVDCRAADVRPYLSFAAKKEINFQFGVKSLDLKQKYEYWKNHIFLAKSSVDALTLELVELMAQELGLSPKKS